MEKVLRIRKNDSLVKKEGRSFIETLLDTGIISADQLHIAKIEHLNSDEPLDALLVKLGFLSDQLLIEMKSALAGYLKLDAEKIQIDRKLLQILPRQEAETLKILPLYHTECDFHVAVCDPEDIRIFDRLKILYQGISCFTVYLATPTELLKAIDQHYECERPLGRILQSCHDSILLDTSLPETAGVEFLQELFSDAVKHHASDIHFEPEEKFVRIRYRIDGVLKQIYAFHQHYWSMFCVRLKIISGLNIAESRFPQDGRFSLNICGQDIDFRVSCVPSHYGENIVIRILEKRYSLKPLEKLGLSPLQIETIENILQTPEGIFIVTGPTGSGKTTTLYSMLHYLSVSSVNIMTLEDPIEYALPHIRQIEICDPGGLTFADGVRAILRQDPDIIFIGEIRDEETAKMAIRASMTGHLVFTTIHTHTVFGVLNRLFDLGLTPRLLEGNLKGILAQRLLRKLCPECKKKTILGHRIIFKAQGCMTCSYTGYRGRTCVAEILPVTEEIEDLIGRQITTLELKRHVKAQGFQSLATQALEKVYTGETSLEEIDRVMGKSEI